METIDRTTPEIMEHAPIPVRNGSEGQALRLRVMLFGAAVLTATAAYYVALRQLLDLSLSSELYSHIVLIPFVCVYFLYDARKTIFSNICYSLPHAAAVIAVAMAILLLGRFYALELNQMDQLSLKILTFVLVIVGAFILFFGMQAFKRALLPLFLMLFMTPFPAAVLQGIIKFLQNGSTEAANFLLWLSGAPYLRDGYIFHLPGMSIEVAEQCSGIRSGLSLFITAILASHLFLRKSWSKITLVVAAIPITIFKNGLRIATLTLLGVYVDPRILASDLHKKGGIPFFGLALLFLGLTLYLLRRLERRSEK